MKSFAAPDGRRLAYRDSGGDGPPVLCLAGLTRNGRDFDPLAEALAPTYRVIRLDSRGRGGSEHAVDPLAEYTIPVETGDAMALLDHLGLAGAAIVGTSRGGILGMAMAAARPGSVRALVMNDVGAVVEGAGLLRIFGTMGRPPRARDFDVAATDLRDANAAAFPGVSLAEWTRHARAIYDREGDRLVLAHDPALRDAVDAALDRDAPTVTLWPLFDAVVDIPVLVVHGANSDILTTATLDSMAARHPGLDRIEIADRGHAPFLTEPEAVAAILRFLDAATTGDPS